MKQIMASFLSAACLLSTTLCGDFLLHHSSEKQEMIHHMIGIQNLFETMYAPAQWKKEYSGWDLHRSVQHTIGKISHHPHASLKDYHEILVEFFNSFKDYHVGVYFHSTEHATLPFRLRGADGHYYVVWRSPSISSDFPIQVGDEIIAFGDKPIEEAIKNLIATTRPDLINQTDMELASIFLTRRMGTLGHRIPQGDVDIIVRSHQDNALYTHSIAWDYTPEFIPPLRKPDFIEKSLTRQEPAKSARELLQRYGSHINMTTPLSGVVEKSMATKLAGAFPIGDRDGEIPPLGEILWTSPAHKRFRSYIYRAESGKAVGYIRIPTFLYNGQDQDLEEKLKELRWLVRQFQRRTESLVIDLTDNTGGYLHICLAYLGIFTDKPLPMLKQRVSITQDDVFDSLCALGEIEALLETNISGDEKKFLEKLKDYFIFVYQQWSEGRQLTDPVFIYGMDQVEPDPVTTYKKPILVLVNGLDFSCADIFPAILQDSKRATIFGSPTAGAGGAIRSHSYPNKLGISDYTYTATFLERLDHRPLENLGVTPDFIYKVSADDMQNGYYGYIKAVNCALE